MATIGHQKLRAFARDALEGAGASEQNARQVADSLVDADLRGHGSHGVIRIPQYAQMATEDALDPEATPDVTDTGPTTAHVEGNLAFGQVVGRHAVPALVERANEHGTAAVGIRNATHLGRVGEWAERTAAEGLAFAAFVNTQGAGLSVAPAGSPERKLATNPIAIGVPTYGELDFPLVLDMATSQVAHGKISRAAAAGKDLPEGWAIDESGESTTDAEAFEDGAGAILPLGGEVSGYKGFGLSIVTELLAGLFGDAPVAGTSEAEWFSNAAAFVALDPLRFTTEERARTKVRGLADHLKEAEYPDSFTAGHAAREGGGLFPGEGEHRELQESLEHGVEIPDGVVSDLREYASEVGVAVPAAFD